MFERFKPTGKELTPEEQDTIDAVLNKVPAVEHEQDVSVTPDGPDENKHPVRSVDDITKLRDEGENPHEFKEAA